MTDDRTENTFLILVTGHRPSVIETGRHQRACVSEGGRAVGPAQVRQGAEGIGPLAGDRVDAIFGFQGTLVVAHFATARPKETGRRFGLTIYGSKGCIWMGTGWVPPAFLLSDPTWIASGPTAWSPITTAGPGRPESAGVVRRLKAERVSHSELRGGWGSADVGAEDSGRGLMAGAGLESAVCRFLEPARCTSQHAPIRIRLPLSKHPVTTENVP